MARLSIVLAALVGAAPAIAQAQAPSALSFEDAVNAAERAAESIAVARAEVDRAEATVSTA